MPDITQQLNAAGIPYRTGVPLKTLSTWQIGGPADYVAEPRSPREIVLARQIAIETGTPWIPLGHGSNILFDDAGYRGLIIKLGHGFKACEFQGTTVTAQAGLWVPNLARACAARGLSGIEHTAGIPGSLGGLIYMNGGSMRRNIGDNVVSVDIIDEGGRQLRLPSEDCGFTYRHSVFQERNAIIISAQLRLNADTPANVRAQMLKILAERRAKFPLDHPNCGSVFSNTADLYAAYGPPGMVIDRAGLKGTRVGDAQVSHRHANFIVNLGAATSADVRALVRTIRAAILERTGYTLHCEVIYLPPNGAPAPLDTFL